jgi:hypothetical protein
VSAGDVPVEASEVCPTATSKARMVNSPKKPATKRFMIIPPIDNTGNRTGIILHIVALET